MSSWGRIGVLTALTAAGLMLSALVPVYNQPFIGCGSRSIFMSEPGCGYWPDLLRGALLVAPVALFIRTKKLLAGFVFGLFAFAALGGLEGMRTGLHIAIFNDYALVFAYILWQAPALLTSILILGVGYMFNVIRERDVR